MSQAVTEVLQQAVESGDVPNAVAMAADRDGPIYEGAAGPRVAGQDDPIGPDSMFRIAPMTKMVATVAALQQRERGTLDFDAPVEQYCPGFAAVQVLDGIDGDTPRLRPPASQATVAQLVTHTSGVTYWFWNADMVRYEELTGTPNVLSGSNEAFKAPMVVDPGTVFEYGINTDWLGKVVESASGQSLDAYLDEHILGPLGMSETTFLMTAEQRERCTPIHVRGDDGWAPTDVDWSQEPDWWAGGHGLYSTPREYLRFQRMLLGNGSLDGVRVLEDETVADAFTNHIGDLDVPSTITTGAPDVSADFLAGPGCKWGWGLLLNTEDQPGRRKAGSGAWAGLFNTHFWVDPTSGITGAVYTQSLPFVEPRVFKLYTDTEKALYASR